MAQPYINLRLNFQLFPPPARNQHATQILSPYGAMYCDTAGAAVAARAKRRMVEANGRTTIGGATTSDKLGDTT